MGILHDKENNGKFSHFFKNINELMDIVNAKMLSLLNKVDPKDSKALENNYLEKMRNIINTNTNNNNLTKIGFSGNTNTPNISDKGKKESFFKLKEFSKNITIGEIKKKEDLKLPFFSNEKNKELGPSKSFFNTQEVDNNKDKKNNEEYENIINKFNNFNLI